MLLITGATGFVAGHLMKMALTKSYRIKATARKKKLDSARLLYPQIDWHQGELTPDCNWDKALVDIDCIIHCAALVHKKIKRQESLQQSYDDVNFHATLQLAKQAAKSGVRRFIFISTIKVNGDTTVPGKPFQPAVQTPPVDPYGLSKYKAEQALKKLANDTAMQVVIIRPTLVYGPKVSANFYSMMKWGCRSIPLPFGAIDNQRSMVYIDNLVDLILTCVTHTKAANQVFLVSDGVDVSISQLLSQIKKVSNSGCLLFPIPVSWFNVVAKITNKQQLVKNLCGSLQVDINETKQLLDWTPSVTWQQGIENTVKDYLENSR
jgi:nucleoside-diphosphate-sugar epimerase